MTQTELMSGLCNSSEIIQAITGAMAGVALDSPVQKTLSYALECELKITELFRKEWDYQLAVDMAMSGNVSRFALRQNG